MAYELIYSIVNAGFSGEVMDAAREAGATGGTVISARGTANLSAEKKFHITIQPDKDIVLLLVPAEIKDNVLHAVYKKVGMDTDGNGIAFSVPVDDAIGIRTENDATGLESENDATGRRTEDEKETEK